MIKPNSLVIFDPAFTEEEWINGWEKAFPFKRGETLVCLGEIRQMPNHCIVVNSKGKVFWGFDSGHFRYPKKEEI